eukprot:31413-Eustigmatos_ZCMA.PRE.1
MYLSKIPDANLRLCRDCQHAQHSTCAADGRLGTKMKSQPRPRESGAAERQVHHSAGARMP